MSTRKKVLQNVWRQGDLCFRSGDILVMDEFGWIYFKDRIGDTYRWKGENVSTAEVEAMISNMVHLKDATVYGVEVTFHILFLSIIYICILLVIMV